MTRARFLPQHVNQREANHGHHHSYRRRWHSRLAGQQGILLNVIVGIIGAVLAGLLLNPLIGGGNIWNGDFSVSSLLVSFLGAVVLLAIVNLVRRGSVR